MNCIFSAQKCAIPVDAVVLNAKQSSFMQQACYLTEGIYLRPDYQSDILQLLITHCLPNITSRKLLKAPLMVYISTVLCYSYIFMSYVDYYVTVFYQSYTYSEVYNIIIIIFIKYLTCL